MKKIVVVSDSHGYIKELELIYNKFSHEASYFLHCGDSELDNEHQIFSKYYSVNGNCDDYSFKDELIFFINNKKILVTHGHYYSVKYDILNLFYYAKERNVDIVCYGHTHYPTAFYYDNVLFVNPGSIYANRGVRGRSFALIEINNDFVSVYHYDLANFNIINKTP